MNSAGKHLYSELSEEAERKLRCCEEYASKYYPKGKIELLIVGESPPIGDNKYFYIPKDLEKNSKALPAKIFRVLFAADKEIDKMQYERYLSEFQKRNFLLIDLCPFPIDCFISSIRAEFIEKEIRAFSEKYKSLNLSASCNKVIILPSGTFKELEKSKYNNVRKELENIGFKKAQIIKWGEIEQHLSKVSEKLRERNAL